MELLGISLVVIASALVIVSSTLILVQAFKKSLWWGFGSLFIPFVEISFIILNWDKTKKYVFWLLLSLVLLLVGGSIK